MLISVKMESVIESMGYFLRKWKDFYDMKKQLWAVGVVFLRIVELIFIFKGLEYKIISP